MKWKMKSLAWALGTLFVLGLPFWAQAAARVAPLRVTVSIPPQRYFVQQIGGELVEVSVMVPPGANPHVFEPKPQQMVALSKSRIYFAIGVTFERAWLKRFAGFNEALDEFYAKTLVVQEASVVSEKFGEHIARQQRILDEQRESLEKAKNEAEEMRRVGEKIYVHFHLLQALTQRIMNEKKEGRTWQQIVSAIEHEKRRGNTPAVYFESLDTKNLFLNLCIDDLSFHLNLRDSVQANASAYYEHIGFYYFIRKLFYCHIFLL